MDQSHHLIYNIFSEATPKCAKTTMVPLVKPTPPKFNIAPEKMMVGRWVSFWDCLFLGAMLNFWGDTSNMGSVEHLYKLGELHPRRRRREPHLKMPSWEKVKHRPKTTNTLGFQKPFVSHEGYIIPTEIYTSSDPVAFKCLLNITAKQRLLGWAPSLMGDPKNQWVSLGFLISPLIISGV